MALHPGSHPKRKKRFSILRQAKRKITTLLRKGTPFNPSKVSGSTLQSAANVGDPLASGIAKKEIRRRIKRSSFR